MTHPAKAAADGAAPLRAVEGGRAGPVLTVADRLDQGELIRACRAAGLAVVGPDCRRPVLVEAVSPAGPARVSLVGFRTLAELAETGRAVARWICETGWLLELVEPHPPVDLFAGVDLLATALARVRYRVRLLDARRIEAARRGASNAVRAELWAEGEVLREELRRLQGQD